MSYEPGATAANLNCPAPFGSRFQRRADGAVARLDAGARDDGELLIPDDALDAPGLFLRTSHSRKTER
jgi:hypothetical protein